MFSLTYNINEEINITYNNINLLTKKETCNAIIFIIIIPDLNIIKINCYYNKLNKNKIKHYFNKYNDYKMYYIVSISGNPESLLHKYDIIFIKNKLY